MAVNGSNNVFADVANTSWRLRMRTLDNWTTLYVVLAKQRVQSKQLTKDGAKQRSIV
jgi:hypothetical protein